MSVDVETPRVAAGGEADESWLCPTPRSLRASANASPCPTHSISHTNVIKDLKGLLERASSTKNASECLQKVLASYEDQVVEVHEELLRVTRKMQRQRRKYSLRVLEKECETKRLMVEAESLRGIIEAKSASMEALKKRHEREREATRTRVEELEAALQEAQQTQNESLKRFEDAGIEIDTAAERLVDAYSDNASLAQQIEDLQCDLEKLTKYSESQERYYSSKIADLGREVEELREQAGGERPLGLPLVAGCDSPSNSGVYSNPLIGNDSSSVTSYGTRDEDILAAEVTNLRAKARELESQASARSNIEREASTLRADNLKLREMLTASMNEASNAQVEIHQLRSESNVLHAQLADVIAQFNMKQEDLAAGVEAPDEIEVAAKPGQADTSGRPGSGPSPGDGSRLNALNLLSATGAVPPTPNDGVELGVAEQGWGRGRHATDAVEEIDEDVDEDIRILLKSALDSVECCAEVLEV